VNRYVGREIHCHAYDAGTGLIGFDDVHCNGTEKSILECSHSVWGVHNCGHSRDVCISCFTAEKGIYVTGVKLKLTKTATIAARCTFYENYNMQIWRYYSSLSMGTFFPDTVYCFSSFCVIVRSRLVKLS